MCRVCECLMDNEVPKQLNLSSNGITNESGTGEPYLLFGFSGSLMSRRIPSTWFLFLEYSRYPHPGGLWTPLSPVSHICYLVFQAHLCPVGSRVLDSCSLNIRAIHIREAYEPPWARAWFSLISWGHKLVWGFVYYPVLMPCFTALFKIVRGAHCTV